MLDSGNKSHNPPPLQSLPDRVPDPFGSVGVFDVDDPIHGIHDMDGEKHENGLAVRFRDGRSRRRRGLVRARHKLDIYSVYSRSKKKFRYFSGGVYNAAVPNVRASGQKQVIVIMSEEFLSDIDDNLSEMGFSSRAEFIRHAVLEKMKSMGKEVDARQAAKPQAPSPKPQAPSPKPQAPSPKPQAPSPKPLIPSVRQGHDERADSLDDGGGWNRARDCNRAGEKIVEWIG
jgi:Arc/MetJ-type ribon-helix-helix transcriptional regulator